MRRRALFAIWTLATLAAMAVAWGVVSAAGAQVADRPLVPVVVASSPTTATTQAEATPTTKAVSPTSTTTSSPPTTQAGSNGTTTTTPPVQEAESRTMSLQGGTVSFTVTVGQVLFEAAVPAPGYVTEIEAVGPEEVRVRFVSSEHTSELRAEWDDGELDIEVREEGED